MSGDAVRRRRCLTVDVFSDRPLAGNPLALVVDGEGLTTGRMQSYAAWTNLSETAFLLPPTDPSADYRVRIFTPDRELPFAGHPTLGSCRGWLEAGGEPRAGSIVVQECGAGLIPIRRQGDSLAFAAPPLLRDEEVSEEDLARFLDAIQLDRDAVVDARWADNGPGWAVLLLDSAETVLAVEPRPSVAGGVLDLGLVGFHPPGGEAAIEVRGLFTSGGVLREDPVTGSLNASVAQWLVGTGRLGTPYVAAQGRRVGRDGRVEVSAADGELWIGGRTSVVVSGHAEL